MATNYDVLLNKIRELGMDYKWARMFVKKLKDDEEAFPVKDEISKEWALKKGFYPGRIELYGINENNWEEYIPDYQYFMLHPLNNHFLKWLDKTTLKYVLNSGGCESAMPEYYVYVENEACGGYYTYLMDCPKDISKDENFLENLLKRKKILALKPNSGTSGGMGFIKLEYIEGDFYENNRQISKERFIDIRDNMRNYIVTEYCHQHHELEKIWPDSECTLRVIMCKDVSQNKYSERTWSCAVSYARFGTSINGGASNLSSGGIGVGFDFETGEYNDFCIRYKRFTKDGKWILDQHPDTGVKWKGNSLPNWNNIKKEIALICNHIASLDYLGFDIIITEDGLKLCEINSHPAIDYEQVLCGPVLMRPKVREFFENKGLFNYSGEAFLRAYKESQE